ncbi:Protein of unknown function with PCYCGC motif-containing protein [Mesobacillus persicus]|uniref:Lipoprotein n=2 Tax=Mesobacillus persicus TaxID=930146 RepID=A0A1H7W222_9BACI|nr:Protein of unknown function with PCYCGC motif-containing protein [Mesobacillus persicus]
MKRLVLLLMMGMFSLGVASGCSSSQAEETLDAKHSSMPDYVLNSSPIVQETYVMAANHQDVLASVPCYCNCYESAGHTSNLSCFIKEVGPDNVVTEWDPHGIA